MGHERKVLKNIDDANRRLLIESMAAVGQSFTSHARICTEKELGELYTDLIRVYNQHIAKNPRYKVTEIPPVEFDIDNDVDGDL